MEKEKIQYTTRLSSELLSEIQKIAKASGASTNSVLALLAAKGLEWYKAKPFTLEG